MHWPEEIFRQKKRCFAKSATIGLAGIECTTKGPTGIGALQLEPQYARNSGDSSIGDTNDEFRCPVTFALPDPGRTNAITETLLEALKAARKMIVVFS